MYALCADLDNVPLCVFDMKEEDYLMILISTYGTNEWVGKTNSGQLVERG